MRKVSIMMLSYNRSAFTKVAIQKMVENLDYPIEKFVLVDNGSTDDTVEWVKSYFGPMFEGQKMVKRFFGVGGKGLIKSCEIIENGKNLGIAVAQNQGAKACAPDSDVVMISNDVFCGPNWLSPLVKCVEEHKEKGIKLGWVSPYMAPEHQFDTIVDAQFRKDYFDLWYPKIINCNDPDSLKMTFDQICDGSFDDFSREFTARNQGKRWDEAVSMMFYWTRESMNEVGLFDEQFSWFTDREGNKKGGWGGEDMDLCLRMNNAGYFRVTCFDSFVFHVVCGTTRKHVLDDPDFAYKDIITGGQFLRKWISDPSKPPLIYPGDLFPGCSKREHSRWLQRKHNTTFGDLFTLDLGLTKEQQAEIDKIELEAQGILVK